MIVILSHKRKMKKKLLAIIVSTLSVLFLLCGCDSGDTKAQSEATQVDTKYEELYASIKKEIEITEDLEKDYFVKYYDLNDLNNAKEAAKVAVMNSDEEAYDKVLEDIKSENEKLSEYLKNEKENIYNSQTVIEMGSEYPFKVKESELPVRWDFKPVEKQTSDYPVWVINIEPQTTDTPWTACLFIGSTSSNYTYVINQIETKEIQVKTPGGEMKNALVNTELKFTVLEGFEYDEKVPLNERPAYLVKQGNAVVLLLQSYDGGEFFVPYK